MPASAPGGRKSEQVFAHRPKPTATKAALGGFGHRKGACEASSSPPSLPDFIERSRLL